MHRATAPSGMLSLASILLVVAATTLPAWADDATSADLEKALENRWYELLRYLPSWDRGYVDDWQTAIERALDVQLRMEPRGEPERLRSAAGDRLPIETRRLVVHGRQPVASLRDWLWRMGGIYGIHWVEELTLQAAVEGAVDLTATVVFASYEYEDPDPNDSRSSVDRLEIWVSEIEALRERPDFRDMALALAAADNAAGGRGTRWTELRFTKGQLELEGVAAGTLALEGVQHKLTESGLAGEIRKESNADCHRVNLSAPVGTISKEIYYSRASGPSFHPDPWKACLAQPSGKLTHLPQLQGDGDFDLYLRDLVANDLFQMLNLLGGGNYVVGGSLGHRLSGDFVGVTEEAIIESLRALTIQVGTGPLRQVTTGALIAYPTETSGESTSVQVRQVTVGAMLCSLGPLAGVEVKVPSDLDHKVDMATREIPTGLVFEAMLAATGLSYESREGRWLISERDAKSKAELVDPCDLRDGGDRFPGFSWDPKELNVADLRLAAIGRHGELWMALAYVPGGDLWDFYVDSELHDAKVKAIDKEGLILSTPSGDHRLTLPQ